MRQNYFVFLLLLFSEVAFNFGLCFGQNFFFFNFFLFYGWHKLCVYRHFLFLHLGNFIIDNRLTTFNCILCLFDWNTRYGFYSFWNKHFCYFNGGLLFLLWYPDTSMKTTCWWCHLHTAFCFYVSIFISHNPVWPPLRGLFYCAFKIFKWVNTDYSWFRWSFFCEYEILSLMHLTTPLLINLLNILHLACTDDFFFFRFGSCFDHSRCRWKIWRCFYHWFKCLIQF